MPLPEKVQLIYGSFIGHGTRQNDNMSFFVMFLVCCQQTNFSTLSCKKRQGKQMSQTESLLFTAVWLCAC